MKTTRTKEFMIGLAKLTRETGIIIGGCGCCASPALNEARDAELTDPDAGYEYGCAGEVRWISHVDDYDWKNFSGSIVRPNGEAFKDGVKHAQGFMAMPNANVTGVPPTDATRE